MGHVFIKYARGPMMERYGLNDNDKMLIEIALAVLKDNFDDRIYKISRAE